MSKLIVSISKLVVEMNVLCFVDIQTFGFSVDAITAFLSGWLSGQYQPHHNFLQRETEPHHQLSRKLVIVPEAPRYNMGQPFQIHHDELDMDEDESVDGNEQSMEESKAITEEDGDQQDDAYSEASDDSSGQVEASVQDDMNRFEDTFKGIKDRFRLINRIGEGTGCLTAMRCIY
jgi:hypothetical protein